MSVFFTGNQVVLANTLKLLKDSGWDLSDYALGISNILILLSFVIAALFIHLIFKELGVEWWLATPATLLIILLCNQWERLGGHYNLAYAYVIPVILYLLLRFYRKPGYLLSVIFGVLVVLFSAKQLYIAAFILILWVPFWIFSFFQNREKFGKPVFIITHMLIQFFIPFLLFNLFTGMHDPGLDRTAFPWGFYPSRIRLEAVFLPEGLPHGRFLNIKGPIRSKAYVGLLGSIVALFILYSAVVKLAGRKGINALLVSENRAWTILFWAGVVSLLIALGIPFSPKWERLLNYTGPFRQLRAVGRFVFPFYYTMTITSFYYLWRWYRNSHLRIKPYLLVVVMLFAGYESFINVYKRPGIHDHAINWHSDLHNQVPEYEWVKRHDFTRYQAIIPLPYFHVGSENYWLGDRSPVRTPAYAASIQTGLPLTAVMLSRTSINQTLMNLDLVYEPGHEYPVLEQLPDPRPFLLLRHKKGEISKHEQRLIGKGALIDESENLTIYSLEIDSIQSMITDRQKELNLLATQEQQPPGILFEGFASLEGGYFAGDLRKPATFFEGMVADTGRYTVSFWYEGTDRDLWPRTVFWTELFREDGSKYLYLYTDFFRKMVLRDGAWGLVEFPVHVKELNSTLKITMKNKYITRGDMVIDRVLIRPENCSHLEKDKHVVWINNRALKDH